MKCGSLLVGIMMIALLTGCGTSGTQADASVPPVPTSPNAAYQTAFPVVGATDVTVLEGRVDGEPVVTPTAEVAPEVVTAPVFEELTPSPETIDVEEQLTPSPETNEVGEETATATP